MLRSKILWIVPAFLIVGHSSARAVGGPEIVTFGKNAGAFALARDGRPAAVYASDADHPGVLRVVGMFRADLEHVTGTLPVFSTASQPPAGPVVIIGTIGKSPLIDALIRTRQLDVRNVAGAWESTLIQTVDHPYPGVPQALVIAGSDKRGTIYGMFRLSEQIGVSPWSWWADVPVQRHRTLSVAAGRYVIASPSVKYRGIFLNDEYPALTRWVHAKFGSAGREGDPPIAEDVANYGRGFYARVFELLLRLKANYLWPAMWNNAFNEDDPENPRLADELGIVMGTSHQEPMLRAQKEWDRRFKKTLGYWNYAKVPDTLHRFWRDGIRRNKEYESIVTIGLRGADDTPMAPGGVDANRALLEHIVDVQRTIITEETGRDATGVPQLWCLYKEVLEYYNAGMRVPDDVTLLWPDDNWGNLRRVPTAEERKRAGGAGIYYHFDYHGSPRSYQWINANPLPKIWDQMTLAQQHGADRIWVVNVGHLKGYELPIEFFMDLAWDTPRWTARDLREYTRLWAARQFGNEEAGAIARIIEDYTRFNGRRKPELLGPSTYSLVNHGEAERVVAEYTSLARQATAIGKRLPAEYQDAYYELVRFPVEACAVVNELYVTAGMNALYAAQGRASASAKAAATRRLFDADTAMMGHFNRDLAGGKWNHFMDQAHLGYVDWADPPENSLRAIPLVDPPVPPVASLGVAVEGSRASWPGPDTTIALLTFDRASTQTRWIEVFNRGSVPFACSVVPDRPWIVVRPAASMVEDQTRMHVTIDWQRARSDERTGAIRISGAGRSVDVRVNVVSGPVAGRITPETLVEENGCVAIEAGHFAHASRAGRAFWEEIPGYGRTRSGMRASADVNTPAFVPGRDAPCLSYRVYMREPGSIRVTAVFGPVLNYRPGRDVRYGVSIDAEEPAVVVLVPKDLVAMHGVQEWEEMVADNRRLGASSHTLLRRGEHTVRIWMIDPGPVLERLIIHREALPPSYLGPPESWRWRGR